MLSRIFSQQLRMPETWVTVIPLDPKTPNKNIKDYIPILNLDRNNAKKLLLVERIKDPEKFKETPELEKIINDYHDIKY